MAVDGVDRVAVAAQAPFFREIGRNSTGDDVIELRRMLDRLGYGDDLGESDIWDVGLQQPVRDLSADLGVSPPTSVFSPAWTVWLPTEQIAVVECAQLGDRVTAGGEFARTAEPIVAIAFPDEALRGENDLVIELGELVIAAPDTARIDDPRTLEEVPRALFTESADGSLTASVSVRYREPLTFTAVPASAVLTASGETCVLLGTPDSYSVIAVDIGSSLIGQALATPKPGEAALTGTVVTNPNQLRNDCSATIS